MIRLLPGDCRSVLCDLPDASVHCCVTDPPYHLIQNGLRLRSMTVDGKGNHLKPRPAGFMNQAWDGGDVAFQPDTWREVLRVLKPGGHLVAFGGTRTSHRMACAIEDAGFEIRDTLCWLYGSGFPKSHDVSKAIDRAAGVMREVVGPKPGLHSRGDHRMADGWHRPWMDDADAVARGMSETAPATSDAQRWQGWGTALKPAWENIICAQKPYALGQLCGMLAQTLVSAICQLPSYVRDAGESSPLSRSVFVEGFGSAQWGAVAECNTPADLCALTATWPSGLVLPSSLSIALSWLDILAVILTHESMFTTETASSLTTDLRTLNSCPLLLTPESIIQGAIQRNGIGSNASIAARIFSAVVLRLEITQELSASGFATSQQGGQALSPSYEPIILARRPLQGTVAANVLAHGTGAINVDACRVAGTVTTNPLVRNAQGFQSNGLANQGETGGGVVSEGRWPANVLHDGSDEVEAAFAAFGDAPGQQWASSDADRSRLNCYGATSDTGKQYEPRGDTGSASRFFFSSKANKDDRADSKHPTVKPVALMRWLVKLVCPPGGTVLDCFAGSGTTGEAATLEGFDAVLIEQDAQHVADIRHRMVRWSGEDLPLFASPPPASDDAYDRDMRDLFAEAAL